MELKDILIKDAKIVLSKIDFTQMEGKTILVTGGSGLIGINLLAVLSQVKNIKIYTTITKTYQLLFDILKDCDKTIIVIDLAMDSIKWVPEFDYIIHSACYSQPNKFMDSQIKTVQLNTTALINCASKLKSNGKLLFISSSEVYSGLENPPFREEQIGSSTPTHPRACYIESKRTGEAICGTYRNSGLDVKVARVGLTYGPGAKKGDRRVLPEFIQKALNDKCISLLDSGKTIRTFSYISDTIENLFYILLFGKDLIYNVGGDSKFSIVELANKIGFILDVPVILPVVENEILGAPSDVVLNLDKTTNEFNKVDYVNIDEGLKRTIEYQKLL